MTDENTEQDMQSQISLGPQQHPITGEIGITLRVGESSTWMSLQDAQSLITSLSSVTFTTLATNTMMQLISASQQQNQLIIPS